MARSAGLVVEHDGGLCFIPASVARRVVRRPVVSRVAGTELGMTLFEGRVIAVFELGPHAGELVVCDVNGEPVALAGLRVISSGLYLEGAGGSSVECVEGPAVLFDVAGAVHDCERRLWLQAQGTRIS